MVNMKECPIALLCAFLVRRPIGQSRVKREIIARQSKLIFRVGINVHQEAIGEDDRNYVVILSGLRGVDAPLLARGVLGEGSSLGRIRTR